MQSPSLNPINRQAALFIGRPRVKTLREALEIFAARITSPETTEAVKRVIEEGASPRLKLIVWKNKDGTYGARLTAEAEQQFECTTFSNII